MLLRKINTAKKSKGVATLLVKCKIVAKAYIHREKRDGFSSLNSTKTIEIMKPKRTRADKKHSTFCPIYFDFQGIIPPNRCSRLLYELYR